MNLLKPILKHKPITLTVDKTEKLPLSSGIYLFHNNETVNYVGKSINIKARVKSHIENAKKDIKEAGIFDSSMYLSYIVTDTEFNALLLESELIKKYRPKFNVRWRDDKSYLYIKITIKDTYPKLFPVRKEMKPESLYFGPFSSLRQVYEIINTLRKAIPFCIQKKLSKSRCFYSKINLCSPCPNEINQIKDNKLKRLLQQKYRHNIRQVTKVLRGEANSVLSSMYRELKKLTKSQKFEEAIELRNRTLNLERVLHTRSFYPQEEVSYNLSEKSLKELTKILQPYFPKILPPQRVECFDVSNLGQSYKTASMVVFTKGLADKTEYRRFKIKNTNLKSDFEMLEEVVKRRFKNNWDRPDLIVIDGGKPQLRRIINSLSSLKIKTPLIGIAKRPDRLIVGPDLVTIHPAINNPGFTLVRQIRDESHRFAKKYHHLLHSKGLFQ